MTIKIQVDKAQEFKASSDDIDIILNWLVFVIYVLGMVTCMLCILIRAYLPSRNSQMSQ